VNLSLRTLFESPTIDGIAKHLARAWGDPEVIDEIARIYLELEHLSDSEAKTLVEAHDL
jgi:hypothetical protein